jgi:hypothetical protein
MCTSRALRSISTMTFKDFAKRWGARQFFCTWHLSFTTTAIFPRPSLHNLTNIPFVPNSPSLQCSRFHPIAEFDGYRRTCRIRLAQHNTRRRLIRAMQRADREASPPQSSGEDYRARAKYIPRAVLSYQQQQQQHPGMYQQVPRYQSQQQFAPAQLSARPASNGNGDMHSALLEVALAQLGGSDSPHGAGHGDHLNNGNDASQPAVYNPHASYSLPQSAPVSHVDTYRPSPLSQQHQLLQQLMPSGSADVASLLNNVDPQQLVQMLQLILSLQQMGCSLDQLEHPEVLPLMMSLLQAA